MVRLISLACIFLLCIVAQESNVDANPSSVLGYAFKVFQVSKKLERYITHKPSKTQKMINEINAAKKELLKPLKEIPYDIRDLKGSVIQKIDNIKTKVEVDSGKFFEYVRLIDDLYDKLQLNIENIPIANSTWMQFIDAVTSLESLRSTYVNNMHHALTSKDLKQSSLLFKLAQMDMELMCARSQSSELIILELYETVKLTDVKDLTMKLFGYNLKRQFEPENTFEGEVNIARIEFLRRMNATYDAVRNAMSIASRDLYRCDPNENIKGVTYENACDGNFNTNNYFSLTGSYADTDRNYVVTGAKIILENNIFYIKIQQGLLGPNATIIPNTVEWKSIKKIFEIRLWGGFQNAYRVDKKQHAVYLDDVEPSKTDNRLNQVVTGLKFGQIGSNLQLQVASMSYNDAGELYGVNTWHNSDYTKARTELPIGADDPINFSNSLRHTQDSHHGQFVNFRFGANTVPFIDVQEVTSNPPVPLAGAGLFHKGQQNSAGYLALKLIHYDLSNVI